jgi:arabinofuranosyltransferase
MSPEEPGAPAPLLRLVRLFLLALFAIVLFRHAWVSDDAYITFRTIDNFIHGDGLRWNAAERVQSYTHPLWMLLFTPVYFVTRETFFTAIVFSAALSLAAVWLVAYRHARSATAGALALVALGASLSFVDYSTSGLENPLSHLLLGLFFLLYLDGDRSPRAILRLSLVACGVTLNRLDLVLVVAPALAEAVWETRRPRLLLQVLAGFAPLLAWELFSIVYYGFPFPNTAYAKLGTAHPTREVLEQGFFYFVTTLDLDPVTLLLIAVGLAVPLAGRRRRELAVVCGVALYLFYLFRIGGDFMLGRFLSAPLYVAVMMLARAPQLPATPVGLVPAALVFLVGVFAQYPTLRADGDYKNDRSRRLKDDRGIADERAFYHDTNSLLSATRDPKMPRRAQWAQDGLKASKYPHKTVIFWPTGMSGFFAGRGKHVIDFYALTDPLLARLPAFWIPDWRIGHAFRYVPDGYIETLETGENRIVDQKLARFYDDLRLVTRGPLFSGARLSAIWRLNTGSNDALVEVEKYRRPKTRDVPIARLKIVDGGNPPAPEPIGETPAGIWVKLDGVVKEPAITIRAEADDSYRVAFTKGWQETGSVVLPKVPGAGMHDHAVKVPDLTRGDGYDGMRIVPLEGNGKYAVGGIKLGR